MILPTKRLSTDRSLLAIGGSIIHLLDRPKTVSRVWYELKSVRQSRGSQSSVSYDWFILALDLLYTMNAVNLRDGLLGKSTDDTSNI